MPVPVNTVAPVVSGDAPSGNTLSTTNGTWTNSPTSYTYQWTANSVNISGATSSTYVTVPSQIGDTIGCTVTATNLSGSGTPTASSNTITVTELLSLCATIATYLASVSSLNLTLGTNCFYSFMLDEPDQIVVVLERPGAQSLLTMTGPAGVSGTAQSQSLLDQPLVQVRTRAATGAYVAGNFLTQQVFGALQGLSNQEIPTGQMEFLLLTATGFPAFLGTDGRQRPEWSLTLRCILQNTQRVLA